MYIAKQLVIQHSIVAVTIIVIQKLKVLIEFLQNEIQEESKTRSVIHRFTYLCGSNINSYHWSIRLLDLHLYQGAIV
jgi:hypothetical protein